MNPGTSESFSTFCAADYLRTEEDIANYLRACQEEDGTDAEFMSAVQRDVDHARQRIRERLCPECHKTGA